MKHPVLIITWLLLLLTPTFGSNLEDLAREGYAVISETQVDGEFNGCEYGKRIRFMNGLIFICSEYSYSYSYMPDVLILKNIRTGDLKVLINDDEYDGNLYRR